MKKYLTILICALVGVESFQPAVDPDLGWHLRYGQYFFQTGHILRNNIISFVWPQYQWVQASWGYDLIVYQLFHHFSFLGLAITSALLTVCTFLIITWPQKKLHPTELLLLAIIFMAAVAPMWAAGMRTPTISTLCLAVALVIADSAYVRFLPVVMLVWANLHGGFALGLILITVWWIADRRKRNFSHLSLLALCWLTPLINPWGLRVYEETFKHTTNVSLNIISEWLPLYLLKTESVVTACMILFTTAVLLNVQKTRAIPYLAMIALATYLAYSANRFVIVLGVLLVYALAKNLPHVRVFWSRRLWIQIVLTIGIIAIVPMDMFWFKKYFQPPTPTVFRFSWDDYCAATLYCSENITSLMNASPPQGNGFHPYNYGGYLSWRVPTVKTFIDGRMVAWEQDGKTPPATEGDWVFMQKGPIAFTKFDHDYHFMWAIIPTESAVADYLNDLVTNGEWERRFRDTNYSYFVKR